MKSRSIILVLVLALFFSGIPAINVNAGDIILADADLDEGVYDITAKKVEVVLPATITTGDDKDLLTQNMYVISQRIPYGEANGETIIPINIKAKGILILTTHGEAEDSITFESSIYEDEACTKQLSNNQSKVKMTKGGTYYLKVKSTVSNVYKQQKYRGYLGISFITGENQEVESGRWYCSSIISSKDSVLYKMKATKTSKIVIKADKNPGTITLLDSKKKAKTQSVTVASGKRIIYVIPKGTYYLKVTSKKDHFRILPTITAIYDHTGVSKSKATSIKVKGTSKAGYVSINDKTSRIDWLKLNNTKKQSISISVKGNVSGGSINIQFVDAKGHSFGTVKLGPGNSITKEIHISEVVNGVKQKQLRKGTYYIKIQKSNSKVSGTYSVQVLNK